MVQPQIVWSDGMFETTGLPGDVLTHSAFVPNLLCSIVYVCGDSPEFSVTQQIFDGSVRGVAKFSVDPSQFLVGIWRLRCFLFRPAGN